MRETLETIQIIDKNTEKSAGGMRRFCKGTKGLLKGCV